MPGRAEGQFMRNLSPLDSFLLERGADGYLFDDAEDSDQYYLSGFDAPDPFVTLYAPDELAVLVSGLEYGRAKKESRADVVCRQSDYGYRDLVDEHGPVGGRIQTIKRFLADRGVGSVVVPERFPTATADGLRDQGVDLEAETDGVITGIRARKTDKEIEHIRAAQRANEAAMARAEELLRNSTVDHGIIHHRGEPLQSEDVKQAIEIELIRRGCALDETIVACGVDAADPHDRGSGPLKADEPIVIDIFPRDTETRYHADMTRTFVKGHPSKELEERYELTLAAQQAAFDAIEPSVTGAAVHDAVCDVYEDAGHVTLRSDESAETGFIHGTGHGIGLDVHELPRLAPGGGTLEPGHVVTVEPGLYDPAVGGIRIEDIVVVTEGGHENLTDYPKEFTV